MISGYTCPDGYRFLQSNMNADVEHLKTEDGLKIKECKDECDILDQCDFFVYVHLRKQCDLLKFLRRSFVLEIGLTTDSIFCIKPSKL